MPNLPNPLKRNRPKVHPPSPLQPYVDSNAGPGWLLCGHLIEKLPNIIWVAVLGLSMWFGKPYLLAEMERLRHPPSATIETPTAVASARDATMTPASTPPTSP
jgi:hypothetical protein